GGSLVMGGDNSPTTYAGNINSASGNIYKSGSGAMTLAGTNVCTVFIEQGALLINGIQSGGQILLDGGVLGGSGAVGIIGGSLPGTISPGNSPGVLTCSNVTFGGSTFDVE